MTIERVPTQVLYRVDTNREKIGFSLRAGGDWTFTNSYRNHPLCTFYFNRGYAQEILKNKEAFKLDCISFFI